MANNYRLEIIFKYFGIPTRELNLSGDPLYYEPDKWHYEFSVSKTNFIILGSDFIEPKNLASGPAIREYIRDTSPQDDYLSSIIPTTYSLTPTTSGRLFYHNEHKPVKKGCEPILADYIFLIAYPSGPTAIEKYLRRKINTEESAPPISRSSNI